MKSEFKTVSFPKKPPASRLRFYLMLLVFMIPLTLFLLRVDLVFTKSISRLLIVRLQLKEY